MRRSRLDGQDVVRMVLLGQRYTIQGGGDGDGCDRSYTHRSIIYIKGHGGGSNGFGKDFFVQDSTQLRRQGVQKNALC